MEYSDTYRGTMNYFIQFIHGPSTTAANNRSIDNSASYKVMVRYELKRSGCEIPTVIGALAGAELSSHEDDRIYVSPLFISTYYDYKAVSGPEAIIKWFNKEREGRIIKILTDKGEIFYGNNGIILDKDFTPLCLATAVVHWDEEMGTYSIDKYILHVHSKVFTDDNVAMNKALARKAIPYYLSNGVEDFGWNGRNNRPVEIRIGDCSEFIVKAKDYKEEKLDNATFTKVLQDNIDEVLTQLIDDDDR